MSYYSKWHLMTEGEAVDILDPVGFLHWLGNLKNTASEGMEQLIAHGVSEDIIKETATRKVLEKTYKFYGLYLKGEYSGSAINHFDPGKDDVLGFIGELSQFTGDLTFLVEVEGWPSLDPGYLFIVRAHKGRATVKSATVVEARD